MGLCALVLFYNALGYVILHLNKPRFLPLTAAAGRGPKGWWGRLTAAAPAPAEGSAAKKQVQLQGSELV